MRLHLACAAVAAACAGTLVHAQNQTLTPEDRAMLVLNTARAAYNQKNYPVAADRFRQFIKDATAGNFATREMAGARYGLALTILDGPEKDCNAAADLLTAVVAVPDFTDRAYASYYLGVALRAQGLQSLEKAKGKNPQEAQQHANTARLRFEKAAAQFGAAAVGLATAGQHEWATRTRCEQAEALLRIGHAKEAISAVQLLAKDPELARSAYGKQAIYLLGYAQFLCGDYNASSRTLVALAPFTDAIIGGHVRYLLARAHHMAEERPEAMAAYEAVLAAHSADRKLAEDAQRNPAAYANRTEEKARLDALLREAPDYVERSAFYIAVLLLEQDKPNEAIARFGAFAQQYPKSALLPEAQFRTAMAQHQLRQFEDSIKTLMPLADHQQLGEQALIWLGRSRLAGADIANAQNYQQHVAIAAEFFRRAYDRLKANGIGSADPDRKVRRAEALLELGDALQAGKQYKEAAAIYGKLGGEGVPQVQEAAMARQAAALQLAGLFSDSDAVCTKFAAACPKSAFLSDVLFRSAENSFLAAGNVSNSASQDIEQKRLYGEAAKRYAAMLDKFPGAATADRARHALGMSQYQLGHHAEAAKVLSAIPESARCGELASVSYLLADCRLRTLPAEADDAISMARLIEQLREIATSLNAFVTSQENSPYTPDALIKMGYAHQRVALAMEDPQDRKASFTSARQAYQNFAQKFNAHPLMAVAAFENAKCMAQLGEFGAATNQLRKFMTDPLNKAPVAPLALIRLGEYMRKSRPDEAVKLLTDVRTQYEQQLVKDPARVEWAALLQYNLGLALKDAGKPAEARKMFEGLIKQFPNRPEAAEAIWRNAQTRREEALLKLEAARRALSSAGSSADKVTAAQQLLAGAKEALRSAGDYIKTQSEAFAQKPAMLSLRLRMIYEAAWVQRTLADLEIESAREEIARKALQAHLAQIGKNGTSSARVSAGRATEIPLGAVPLQPSEGKMRDLYKTLIAANPDAPLANDARFELGDLLSQRGEYDPAIKLLTEAMESDPAPDLADRVRLRLGGCYLAKGDAKNAAAQFNGILQNPKATLLPQARYGIGECLMIEQRYDEAIKQFIPFRDQELLRGVAAAADRALLRLGQAYAQLGQWDQSRSALQLLVQRFPSSPWANEARFNLAWALQNQKQYDQAIQAYEEVTSRTGTEMAAKAQLQVGICHRAMKRNKEALAALQSVEYTYSYPDVSAAAHCEAAGALVDQDRPEEAKKLLQRVMKENPAGKWHELASKRLAEIK